eukprot:364096-Chlamydomonas_euryale.AAC.13
MQAVPGKPSMPGPRALAVAHGSRKTCGCLLKQAMDHRPRRGPWATSPDGRHGEFELGDGRASAILMFSRVTSRSLQDMCNGRQTVEAIKIV